MQPRQKARSEAAAEADLSTLGNPDAVKALIQEHHPEMTSYQIGAHWPQLRDFTKTISPGDWVVMPLRQELQISGTVGEGGSSKAVAVGRAAAEYVYQGPDAQTPHVIPTDWCATFPMLTFRPDLRKAMGLQRTVIRIQADRADGRFRTIVEDDLPDGFESGGSLEGFTAPTPFTKSGLEGLTDESGVHVVWDQAGQLIYAGHSGSQPPRSCPTRPACTAHIERPTGAGTSCVAPASAATSHPEQKAAGQRGRRVGYG